MRNTFIDYDDEESDEECNMTKSVFIIGLPKVGKTSIVTRLVRNEFTLHYSRTKAINIVTHKPFVFYEFPYTYQFDHSFFFQPNIVCIVERIEEAWWKNFLNMVDPKVKMEVIWLTQGKVSKFRQYKVNCLENTGFYTLQNVLTNL